MGLLGMTIGMLQDDKHGVARYDNEERKKGTVNRAPTVIGPKRKADPSTTLGMTNMELLGMKLFLFFKEAVGTLCTKGPRRQKNSRLKGGARGISYAREYHERYYRVNTNRNGARLIANC